MGLEISWYLRLPKYPKVKVVISKKALPQVTHMMKTVEGWDMDSEDQGDNLELTFTRQF